MKRKYESAVAAAVDFLTYKERTEAEVREKLAEYGFAQNQIDDAVLELHESLLLNDEEYAHDFVYSKLAQKPTSIKALRMKLRRHKLDENLIEETLCELPASSDYENAYEEARVFLLNNIPRADDMKKLREKLLRRLISHGYSFDDAKSAINAAECDINEQD